MLTWFHDIWDRSVGSCLIEDGVAVERHVVVRELHHPDTHHPCNKNCALKGMLKHTCTLRTDLLPVKILLHTFVLCYIRHVPSVGRINQLAKSMFFVGSSNQDLRLGQLAKFSSSIIDAIIKNVGIVSPETLSRFRGIQ